MAEAISDTNQNTRAVWRIVLGKFAKVLLILLMVILFLVAVWQTTLRTETFGAQVAGFQNWVVAKFQGETPQESEAPAETPETEKNSVVDKPDPAPGDVRSDIKVPVTTVEVQPLSKTKHEGISRTYTGIIKAARESQLGFKRVGRLASVHVKEGEIAPQGKILAELDTSQLEADKKVLVEEQAAAAAFLAELKKGPRAETIAAAKARLQELKSVADLSRITSDRNLRLVRENAGSQQAYDNARLQNLADQASYQSQREVIRELEAGTRQERIDAQEAEVRKLTARIASLQVKIEESKLRAPYNCVVSERNLDEGSIVSPGQPFLKVLQNEAPEAWIGLPTAVANQLKPGHSYQLNVQGEKNTASLRAILPELDPVTRTHQALFELASNQNLRMGQVVRFQWQDEQNQAGFWIPRSALTFGSRGLWSVFVAVPGEPYRIELRSVEVLQVDNEQVLVRGTLRAGDYLVTGGVQKLAAGQPVDIQFSKQPSSK